MSRSAADHNAVPAPNEGTLPARVVAVPQSITPSPRCRCRISCIRNSFPLLKNFTASRGRGHHQTHTVYAPRSRLKVSLRDDGPNHAKHSAQSETNTSHDVQWVFHIGRSSYSTDQVGRVASDDDVKRA